MTAELTPTKELMDRVRRIETRLTKFMEWSGFDTQSTMPQFKDGALHLPSIDVSLRHILASMPDDAVVVAVMHKGELVATVGKHS